MSGEVYSVRLVVQQQDSGFVGKWIDDDGQESSSFPLVLPMNEDDAAELRWYLEKYRGFVGAGTRVRAQIAEKRIEDLGHRLFAACFEASVGAAVYKKLLEAKEAGRRALLTLGSNEPAVLQQPWELMRDDHGPLALQGVSIRRQLISEKEAPHFEVALPLRVLLIVARPNDAGFIDPRSSMAPLLDGLEALGGLVELAFCEPPTLAELERRISAARAARAPFHIVHFDGHGWFSPDTGEGFLAFEDAKFKLDRVTGQELGTLLKRLEIPLVMLEACRTSDLSDQPVLGSMAPALLESGVGSVVAFSHSVNVEASRILVETFYRELAAGFSVGQALAKARAELGAKPQRRLHAGPKAASVDMQDWFILQLYQVGVDPVFLKEGAAVPQVPEKPRPEERMFGFPPQPMYRFHGRSRELLVMERVLERHPAVLLTGGGGMGKTALAREAAWWWLRTGRFERAVFVSFEQVATVERVVQELGRALDGPAFASRSGEDQEATAVALFRDSKVLLVWDNFESTLPQFQQGEAGGIVNYPEEERVRLRQFFERLTENSAAALGRLVVTCRPAESGLQGIYVKALAGLERHASLHLVHAIADSKEIDLEREGYEREEVEKLLDLLDDYPLSISLVSPHLKELKPAEICADFGVHLEKFKDDTAEGRNRSLRASLAFSTSRLSDAARAVLPWLAWFRGGAFEDHILNFTQLSAQAWSTFRSELEVTALLRVEEVGSNFPFLRFHPTLSFATSPREVGDVGAAELRFLGVYGAVRQWADGALRGQAAAAGMLLMEREEANFRAALELAFCRGERQFGAGLADTLGMYLQMAARLCERDALVDWVQKQMPADAGLDAASCGAIWGQAFSLVGRGRAGEAVVMLQALIQRLETEGIASGEEVAFQLGTSYRELGQVRVNADRPDLAIPVSRRAIEILEKLEGNAAKGNLSAALGDFANACQALGRHEEAFVYAERSLEINRQLGKHRNVAVGLDQCAQIRAAQQRWAEAEALYGEALVLERQIGELELQGISLQHRGSLRYDRGDQERAVEDYEEAIRLFQKAGDAGNEMRTCDLLASTENKQRGQLEAAEAWYRRARELALALGDQYQLGVIAHNVCVLYQTRAEQATGAEREEWLRQALVSVEESLGIKLEMEDQVGAALSYCQLGRLHILIGDLDRAAENTLRGLGVFEDLGLPNIYLVYGDLAEIAAARGDPAAAAEWAAKRDAKLAELERLRAGLPASG